MSLLHEAIIAEKYGMRLTMDDLAKALGLARNTLYNQIAKGTLRVKTYLDGKQRWADYRDVASYLDEQRENASFRV